jgi:hypothetical protein
VSQCPPVNLKGHGFDSELESAWQPEGQGPGVTVKSGPLAPTVTRDPLAAVTGCRRRRLRRAGAAARPRPAGPGARGPPPGRPQAAHWPQCASTEQLSTPARAARRRQPPGAGPAPSEAMSESARAGSGRRCEFKGLEPLTERLSEVGSGGVG